VPEGRRPVPDAADEGRPLRVGDDGRRPRVADGVEDLVLPVDPVCRDRDGADAPEGEVTDEVLRRTLQVDADPVPVLDSEVEEAASDPGDPVPEVGVGVGLSREGMTRAGFLGLWALASRKVVQFGMDGLRSAGVRFDVYTCA